MLLIQLKLYLKFRVLFLSIYDVTFSDNASQEPRVSHTILRVNHQNAVVSHLTKRWCAIARCRKCISSLRVAYQDIVPWRNIYILDLPGSAWLLLACVTVDDSPAAAEGSPQCWLWCSQWWCCPSESSESSESLRTPELGQNLGPLDQREPGIPW